MQTSTQLAPAERELALGCQATNRWWLPLLVLSIVVASSLPAVAEIHVVGKALSSSGHQAEERSTEYEVEFRVTVDGVFIEKWVETVRQKDPGGRSYHGYNKYWIFECADIAADERREDLQDLPKSVSDRVCGECDPSAGEDYERKKKVFEEFLEEYLEYGEEIRHETNEEILHATEEFLGLSAVIESGGQVPGGIEWIKRMRTTKKQVSQTPHSPAAKTAITASYLKLAAWYYELYDIIRRKLGAEAAQDEMLQTAQKTWESALADLRRSLEQSLACVHQRSRAEAHERLRHEMRELIDTWRSSATWEYRDPETKELLSAKEALGRAKEILTRENPSSWRLTAPMAVPASWTPGVLADAGDADFDAEAFARELDRAIEQFEIGMDKLTRREQARVAFQKELETLKGRLQP